MFQTETKYSNIRQKQNKKKSRVLKQAQTGNSLREKTPKVIVDERFSSCLIRGEKYSNLSRSCKDDVNNLRDTDECCNAVRLSLLQKWTPDLLTAQYAFWERSHCILPCWFFSFLFGKIFRLQSWPLDDFTPTGSKERKSGHLAFLGVSLTALQLKWSLLTWRDAFLSSFLTTASKNFFFLRHPGEAVRVRWSNLPPSKEASFSTLQPPSSAMTCKVTWARTQTYPRASSMPKHFLTCLTFCKQPGFERLRYARSLVDRALSVIKELNLSRI